MLISVLYSIIKSVFAWIRWNLDSRIFAKVEVTFQVKFEFFTLCRRVTFQLCGVWGLISNPNAVFASVICSIVSCLKHTAMWLSIYPSKPLEVIHRMSKGFVNFQNVLQPSLQRLSPSLKSANDFLCDMRSSNEGRVGRGINIDIKPTSNST